MRVVRIEGNGALDLRAGRLVLAVLRQRHGMVRQKPEIVTVVCRQAVQEVGDLVLLPDLAGGADEAVRVGGGAEHQGVARPACKVRLQRSDGGFGAAREHQIEKGQVAGLARRQTGGHGLGFLEARPCGHDVAFPHQHLCLAGMGQGEAGIGGDGAVKGLDRAGVERQQKVASLDVGVARDRGRAGQGKAVSVCRHAGSSPIYRESYHSHGPQAVRYPARDGDARARKPGLTFT